MVLGRVFDEPLGQLVGQLGVGAEEIHGAGLASFAPRAQKNEPGHAGPVVGGRAISRRRA